MTVTKEQVVAAGLTDAKTAGLVTDGLNAAMKKWGIATPRRCAAFLAQCAHESCGFRVLSENLNYSAQGLLKVFPRRVTGYDAPKLARNPEAVANHVYSNRLGNGPKESGDGWRFRGRGFIQLTGRSNYTAFAKDSGIDCVNQPDLLTDPRYAAESAAWFWVKRASLNDEADTPGVEDETKGVNGGLTGVDERRRHFDALLKLLEKAEEA